MGCGPCSACNISGHQMAVGAFCFAADHLKVKLPSDGEKLWWEDLDITRRQLEEIKSQILELYNKIKLVVVVPSDQRSEITQSGSSGHHQVVSSAARVSSFYKEEPGSREGVDHHGKGDKEASAGPEKVYHVASHDRHKLSEGAVGQEEAPQPEEREILEGGDDIGPPWEGKKQLVSSSSSSFANGGGFIKMVGRKRSRDGSVQNDDRY